MTHTQHNKVIIVENLRKEFKTAKREPGIRKAIKALFRRNYETSLALKGVSFTVEKGEILGFIGPNGAGKSTTIKALSGVLHPTSGTVEVLGYTPWKQREAYVANIGVVFGQKPQLWWDLPAMDSFYLNKDIYNIPETDFQRRLKRMITRLGIQEVAKTPVRDLSLGERMKCTLVASLLHNPKLVFLDEPSIGLDVIAKNVMRDFIQEMNKKHQTTFIITTHDMQEIERLCKRIIIINKGKLVYDGSLAEVKKQYQTFKVIDIKLEEDKKGFTHKGVTVKSKKPYELLLEVDTKKTSVKEVIDYVLKNYEVADINITDPPIEEIIETIYKK